MNRARACCTKLEPARSTRLVFPSGLNPNQARLRRLVPRISTGNIFSVTLSAVVLRTFNFFGRFQMVSGTSMKPKLIFCAKLGEAHARIDLDGFYCLKFVNQTFPNSLSHATAVALTDNISRTMFFQNSIVLAGVFHHCRCVSLKD